MKKGKFIVIEGTDGSGKTEQTVRLVSRLRQSGFDLSVFDFPRYSEPSSYFVQEYLNGRFGTLEEINPHTASLFYALDRYAASRDIRSALEEGKTVISNRYVGSNLGHQGSKFGKEEERKSYFSWDYDLEYKVNGIPKPDLNIVLFVPPEVAQSLVDRKVERQYLGGKKRDLHETDLNHLKRTHEVYRELVRLYPGDFVAVECVENEKLLTIEEIHEKVWEEVRKILGSRP